MNCKRCGFLIMPNENSCRRCGLVVSNQVNPQMSQTNTQAVNPQMVKPMPQGTAQTANPQMVRPMPQGTAQTANPQMVRPMSQGTAQTSNPQMVRPMPQGTAQAVNPQMARPIPNGQADQNQINAQQQMLRTNMTMPMTSSTNMSTLMKNDNVPTPTKTEKKSRKVIFKAMIGVVVMLAIAVAIISIKIVFFSNTANHVLNKRLYFYVPKTWSEIDNSEEIYQKDKACSIKGESFIGDVRSSMKSGLEYSYNGTFAYKKINDMDFDYISATVKGVEVYDYIYFNDNMTYHFSFKITNDNKECNSYLKHLEDSLEYKA